MHIYRYQGRILIKGIYFFINFFFLDTSKISDGCWIRQIFKNVIKQVVKYEAAPFRVRPSQTIKIYVVCNI